MNENKSFRAMYFAFAMIIFNISLTIVNYLGVFGSSPVKPLDLSVFGSYSYLIGEIGGLMTIGSIISYTFTKSAMAVIIPIYSGIFWTFFSTAYFGVFKPLLEWMSLGWLSPFIIFLSAMVFLAGAVQLATGGWKSYV